MKKFITIGCLILGFYSNAQHKKTVLLDRYFNSEKRKDINGNLNYWHYTWEEQSDPGFSIFGSIFTAQGMQLSSLDTAPTKRSLNKAGIYIIVDPDHAKDNPHPNYMTKIDADIIYKWVKQGGVLLLLANDSANCDLKHFNILASKFGMTFLNASINMVKNDQFETGATLSDSTTAFDKRYKLFLKDISTIKLTDPAKSVIEKNGSTVMGKSMIGKGMVLAVGDPWLYNEYVNGRLPADFENDKAAESLVKWLIRQAN